jgi:hypothetical protein
MRGAQHRRRIFHLASDERADQPQTEHGPLRGHGVVAAPPPTQLIETDDEGGVLTFTVVGAANGVPPVVVVVVVEVVVGVPPLVGALASDRVVFSLEQALVTEGVALHVGQDPPPTTASPPSPQPALARAPSATTSIRRRILGVLMGVILLSLGLAAGVFGVIGWVLLRELGRGDGRASAVQGRVAAAALGLAALAVGLVWLWVTLSP